jgi:hypothetical protein
LLAACGGDDGETIGPDASVDGPPPGIDVVAVPTACVAERALADRPDDHGFDQIRLLYVVPSDLLDREFDTNGKICNSVQAFAGWFHSRAGEQFLRFDTQGGMLDIGFVRLAKTDAEMRGTDPNNTSIATGTAFVRESIERELEAMGMIAANKLYGVYYDGSSVYACGGGAWPPLIEDRVGAVYLRGMPPGVTSNCGDTLPWGQPSLVPNYVDYAILHELVHSLGFVPESAPHEHASGHVFDGTPDSNRDLMYSPRTSADPPWGVIDPSGLILDINHDDYYTVAPALDLAKTTLLAPLADGAQRPIGW